MTTRTKHLLQRSRDLLERSRVAAVQLLDPPRGTTTALPRVIEGSRESMIHTEPEGAVVDICASIALRDLNLVDSLLSLLERMEESEADPDRLTELYKLDHLAARLRRNAENLRVLAGRDASDTMSDSASLVDVIRAAMSSIDGYSRVSIGRVLSLGVTGIAADDLSRLLAELLDNGAKQSPPDTTVRVSAHLTDSGSVLLRIEDDGIGLPPERIAELNSRLSDEPTLNDDSVRHMGLAVVRRLAARHDMRVHLDRRAPHGTTATVLLPSGLVCELPGDAWSGSQTVVRPARPDHSEPAVARTPAPRPASEHTRTTAGGLPKRTPSGGRVATRAPSPQDLTEPGRTANGLPRRVSRSIKSPEHGDEAPAVRATPEEEQAGHEQLLADLDAFAAGEQAAKQDAWPATDTADSTRTEPAAEPGVAGGPAAGQNVAAGPATGPDVARGPGLEPGTAADPATAAATDAAAADLAETASAGEAPDADAGTAEPLAPEADPPPAEAEPESEVSGPGTGSVVDAPVEQAPEPFAGPESGPRPSPVPRHRADSEDDAPEPTDPRSEFAASPERTGPSEPIDPHSELTAPPEPAIPRAPTTPPTPTTPSEPTAPAELAAPTVSGEPTTPEPPPASDRYPSEPLSFEPLRPVEPLRPAEQPGYAPDAMFDDAPTPPRGFPAPIERDRPGGATP